MQRELTAVGGKPKREVALMNVRDDLLEIAYQVAGDRIEAALYTSGMARSKAVDSLRKEVEANLSGKTIPRRRPFEISQAFDYLQKAFRVSILDRQKRCDGRGFHDLRPLSAEVGLLPRSHGSPFCARRTQAVALATLLQPKKRK